ncbi:MAG: hypothetical protein ACQKBU_00200, partial [Verrucomicrobiales bacterium]
MMLGFDRYGPDGCVRPPGFVLLATVALSVILVLLAVSLLSISSIQLRSSESGKEMALARANARLALSLAIGQLQEQLGPDQRVSALAEIIGDEDRQWTGVWSSIDEDGESWWQRDKDTGSWTDYRSTDGWNRESAVRHWLVSGSSRPGSVVDRVTVVGEGSVLPGEEVSVPVLDVWGGGRLAWWTGDLGVRASLGVADAHEGEDSAEPGRATYSRVVTQQAEVSFMGVDPEWSGEDRRRLVSADTMELIEGNEWVREHYWDFTREARGVLADVRDGGLKRDLSAFFASDGSLPPLQNLAGISDSDSLFLEAEESRYFEVGPRLGLLRNWVNSSVPYAGEGVAGVLPEVFSEAEDRRQLEVDSETYALSNENPIRVAGATQSALQPVLVEASQFLQISSFPVLDDGVSRYQLRHHLYPRVVLWNPYNVELIFDPAMVMIQGNGRQEMWTENEYYDSQGRVIYRSKSQWLSLEGGRSTRFTPDPDLGEGSIFDTEGYNDPYMGSYYFSIPQTTFGPGECLVFSPARSAEYDGLSYYRDGSYNLALNELSCEVAPDPSRSFYVSGSSLEAISFRPVRYWYAPTPYWSSDGKGVDHQSDDTRVVVKSLVGASEVTFEDFDALPQLMYLSSSLQFGAGREPRIAWDDQSPMEMELLTLESPRPTLEPDVRTRQGIRLRWFEEHLSNLENSGALANETQFFEEALLANWNPRAGYAVRNPWENLGGSLPTAGSSGSGGGPWFFGAYTRDLYDELVGFGEQTPVLREGRQHGNPFGPPQEGFDRYILFELPRSEVGLLSLGQLQHLQLTEFVWHPSFAVGNSLADPRLGREGLSGTLPPTTSEEEAEWGGFSKDAIGWSTEEERSENTDDWAKHGRKLLQDLPEQEHLVYDLSYEANQGVWDRFFLSTGEASTWGDFLEDLDLHPLPNGRLCLAPSTQQEVTLDRLASYHQAAYHLLLRGAFNVNSTRPEAWAAMLAATREEGVGTPFVRLLDTANEKFQGGQSAWSDAAWSATRVLSDEDIVALAEALVEEVKLRGPF